MMILKDLSVDKELDRKAMTDVQGGSNYAFIGGQYVGDGDGISIASPNTVVKSDLVFQDDGDTMLNVLSPLGFNSTF